MIIPIRFSYTLADQGPSEPMARLAMTLSYNGNAIEGVGLLDSGAVVNVLPYRVGVALGLVWEKQALRVRLGGNLGRFEARAVGLKGWHSQITPQGAVKLGFAWTRMEDAPMIFGQANFFRMFKVCFDGAQGIFDIEPRP